VVIVVMIVIVMIVIVMRVIVMRVIVMPVIVAIVIVIVIGVVRALRPDRRPTTDRRKSYARDTRKEYGAIHSNHSTPPSCAATQALCQLSLVRRMPKRSQNVCARFARPLRRRLAFLDCEAKWLREALRCTRLAGNLDPRADHAQREFYVAVISNDLAHLVEVTPGYSNGRNIQIVSGLKGTETVGMNVPPEVVERQALS
jgi:hypothetical protein